MALSVVMAAPSFDDGTGFREVSAVEELLQAQRAAIQFRTALARTTVHCPTECGPLIGVRP